MAISWGVVRSQRAIESVAVCECVTKTRGYVAEALGRAYGGLPFVTDKVERPSPDLEMYRVGRSPLVGTGQGSLDHPPSTRSRLFQWDHRNVSCKENDHLNIVKYSKTANK